MTCTEGHSDLDFCPKCAQETSNLDIERVRENTSFARQVLDYRSRKKLSLFVQRAWHVLEPDIPLDWHWHLERLCDHFQWMIEQHLGIIPRVCQNLAVNVPPGSLKSTIFSVMGPAWVWIRFPSKSFLCLSHGDVVAHRDSEKMIKLVTSDWYRETFRIKWTMPKLPALKDFKNSFHGSRSSRTIGASIVGLRKDIIIYDDLNDTKHVSEIKLEAARMGYIASFNRVNDSRVACRMGIQQRVHEMDWTGIVMEQGNYEHLCIPMTRLDPGTKCGCGKLNCDTTIGLQDPRLPGEILHPERNTDGVRDSELKAMGSAAIAAQHEQRPAPEGGNIFRESWWQYFDVLPVDRGGKFAIDGMVMSVDANFKKTISGSRAAIVVIAIIGERRYVVDVWAKSVGFSDLCHAIESKMDQWPMVDRILVEDAANGTAIIDLLQRGSHNVVPISPQGGKVVRANAIVPAVEFGRVFLQSSAPWLEEFLHETGMFPNGKNDDIVDAVSQALTYLAQETQSYNRILAESRL